MSHQRVLDSTTGGPCTESQWPRATIGAGFWNYGYPRWLVDRSRGDYAARGKDGQFIYVDPGTGGVVVRLGHGMGSYDGRDLTAADWMALFEALAH